MCTSFGHFLSQFFLFIMFMGSLGAKVHDTFPFCNKGFKLQYLDVCV